LDLSAIEEAVFLEDFENIVVVGSHREKRCSEG
jgi:hypothetical protein